MHSKSICWGVLLLLLFLISCREDVRIIEPFSFYPSEIFLSIVPLGKFPILHINIADQICRVSENNSDDSIHNLDSSCPWARLCSLSIRVWGYCHSLMFSDVPVFFFTTLDWRDIVWACFFWETVKLMWFSCLPDHQSVKAPSWLTQRTQSFLLKSRNCRIYPQHLVTFIVLPVIRTWDWL